MQDFSVLPPCNIWYFSLSCSFWTPETARILVPNPSLLFLKQATNPCVKKLKAQSSKTTKRCNATSIIIFKISHEFKLILMLPESWPRHIPAAGDASGAAEPGLRAVLSILLHKLPSAPSYTSKPLGLPGCSCGQSHSYVLLKGRPGAKPCPAVACQNFSEHTGNETVRTHTSGKGMYVLKCFLEILAGSGRMRDLFPSLRGILRDMQ